MIRRLQSLLAAVTLAFLILVIGWAYGLPAAIGASLSLFLALAIGFIAGPLFRWLFRRMGVR
jgi:hypothetical protein